MSKRYSSKPFPPYIFIPGMNPHPKKVGGHMEGESDPIAPKIDPAHPAQNEMFLYALDLYNHGYFWESHVYFEALWNAHGRKDDISDFLKGMIKLGAAGVKVNIDQMESARGHLLRARELFSLLSEKQDTFLGFNLNDLVIEIDTSLEKGIYTFEVYSNSF